MHSKNTSLTTTNRDLENIGVSLDGISVVDIQQLTGNKVFKSLITMKAKKPSAKVNFNESFLD